MDENLDPAAIARRAAEVNKSQATAAISESIADLKQREEGSGERAAADARAETERLEQEIAEKSQRLEEVKALTAGLRTEQIETATITALYELSVEIDGLRDRIQAARTHAEGVLPESEQTDLRGAMLPDRRNNRENDPRTEMNELAEKENKLYKEWSAFLSRFEYSRYQNDTDRANLKQELLKGLLAEFMADYDQNHGPLNSLDEYDRRLSSLEHEFYMTRNRGNLGVGRYVHEGIPYQPGSTSDELFELLGSLAHQEGDDNSNTIRKNAVRVLRLDEHGKPPQGNGGTRFANEIRDLTEFLQSHPRFSRRLAAIEEAASRCGEGRLFRANTDPVAAAKVVVDEAQVDELIVRIMNMNEARIVRQAQHREKATGIEELLRMEAELQEGAVAAEAAEENLKRLEDRERALPLEIKALEETLPSGLKAIAAAFFSPEMRQTRESLLQKRDELDAVKNEIPDHRQVVEARKARIAEFRAKREKLGLGDSFIPEKTLRQRVLDERGIADSIGRYVISQPKRG